MNWIELSVATDAEGAEAVAALLNEFASGGVAIEETLDEPPDRARAFTVRAFFSSDDGGRVVRAETALWHLAQVHAFGAPQQRELAEEDWAEAWKKHYTIVHLGKALVIKPSWLEYTPRAGETIVELDPGMAFGTGLHPTTRQCLIALEERMTPGARVLDVGAGSGILAITAATLGARAVLALDTDAIAVETAARNVALNQVESIVHVKRGSMDTAHSDAPFDLICINILAEVICDLAPALAAALRDNGVVIASGILDYKADGVIDALRAVDIETAEKKQEDDWVTLVGRRMKAEEPALNEVKG